jgi:outer membrane immunogenic protein
MRYRHSMTGALALVCLCNVGPVVAEEAASAVAEPAATEPVAAETSPADDAQWSGFYAGISYGSRTLEADWTTTQVRNPNGVEVDMLPDSQASLENSEKEPGLFIGYNWEFDARWVLSAEIVSQLYKHSTSIEDRIPGLSDPDSDPHGYVLINAENVDSFDPRLRGGYLLTPQLLLYAAASKTGLDVEATTVCPRDGIVCNPFLNSPVSHTSSMVLNATVLGLGAEYKFNRLQLRLEYLQADYGGSDFTALPDDPFLSFGVDARMDLTSRTLVLGLSYGL